MIPKRVRYLGDTSIKFKSIESNGLSRFALHALRQIEEKEYETIAISSGISTQQVRRLDIVLQGKRIAVARSEEKDSINAPAFRNSFFIKIYN